MSADEIQPNTLRVKENGSLVLQGDIRFGEKEMKRAFLCRCGMSANKPFCDGSHSKNGFEATGECDVTDKDTAEGIGGPVEITENPNGSVKLTGNLEIVTDSGTTVARTNAVRLCRCGHSNKKPFCDGSHKAAGFTTE